MADSGEVSIAEEYTHGIWDQGSEPICMCIAGADMLTILYRMLGFGDLDLSPKILIDARCFSIDDLIAIVTNPSLGLQSIRDYPFMFTRTLHKKIEYQQGARYWIDKLITYSDKSDIEYAIKENYSEHGKKLPLLACVLMGDFVYNEDSLAAFEKPFRHNMDDELYVKSLIKQEAHTLLIVGANFSSNNESEHYLLVKNSYTEEWGQDGFSKMALEMVQTLAIPVLEKPRISYVGWEEERTWTAGKITLNEMRSESGQHDGQTEITRMERIIIVSNLRLHTPKSAIYNYFNGTLRAEVTDITFNSFEDKYYNKSCLVTFSSIETAEGVRNIQSHQIEGVEVTVEQYLGKEYHQKVFQRGENRLFLKGMNEVSVRHKLCEKIASRCGPHSDIVFRREKDGGRHNGKVVIPFYEESHRDMALDTIRKEYKWDASLTESDDEGNQD